MKRLRVFKVHVRFDEEAQVWYVHESNVPGLRAEADTPEELRQEVLELLPLLVQANEICVPQSRDDHRQVPLDLIVQQREYVNIGC